MGHAAKAREQERKARARLRAVLVGGWALAQLWMFWVAPRIGAALAGFTFRWFANERESELTAA